MRPEDTKAFASIVGDPRVMRFLGSGHALTSQEAEAYVLDCVARFRATGRSRFAVTSRNDGELLGFSGFKEIAGTIDFGYRFEFHQWGRGIATEAGNAVLRYGFDSLGFDRVWAGVVPGNQASLNVLCKLRFLPAPPPYPDEQDTVWHLLTANAFHGSGSRSIGPRPKNNL